MGIAFIVLGLLVFLGSIGALIYLINKFCKSLPLGGNIPKIEGDNRLFFLSLVGAGGFGFVIASIGMVLFNKWQLSVPNYVLLIAGGLLAGLSINLFISSFGLYFYRKDLDPKQRKIAQICFICATPIIFIGLWMWSDSYAANVFYPLPNSISFSNGFGYPDGANYGFTIAFYGILIVVGALVSYFVSDHYIYVKYGKHGLIDSLFLIAFPLGLIGARLWWCCVLEPKSIFYDNFGDSFIRLIDIRNGGLAIQGGAMLGMISGILFVLKFRKYINIRWIVDVCVPTILIAQSIGRWGNFFNQEVYGMASNIDNWWFLPKIIKYNMIIDGNFRVPLFLIESLINISGYFIIRFAIGRGLKKYLRQGDQGFLYVFWYGLVRVVLERFRNGQFEYSQSWITAFVMVGVGMLGIVGIRVFEYFRRKYGKEVKKYEAI